MSKPKISPVPHPFLLRPARTLYSLFPVTFASAYMWSQIEPAVAILCACLVTYRPLFVNINLNFMKLTSVFTRSSHARSSGKDSIELTDGSGSEMRWPDTQVFDGHDTRRIRQLNARAAKDDLHVVNVEMAMSTP